MIDVRMAIDHEFDVFGAEAELADGFHNHRA
jgi:hypothetical protein